MWSGSRTVRVVPSEGWVVDVWMDGNRTEDVYVVSLGEKEQVERESEIAGQAMLDDGGGFGLLVGRQCEVSLSLSSSRRTGTFVVATPIQSRLTARRATGIFALPQLPPHASSNSRFY